MLIVLSDEESDLVVMTTVVPLMTVMVVMVELLDVLPSGSTGAWIPDSDVLDDVELEASVLVELEASLLVELEASVLIEPEKTVLVEFERTVLVELDVDSNTTVDEFPLLVLCGILNVKVEDGVAFDVVFRPLVVDDVVVLVGRNTPLE